MMPRRGTCPGRGGGSGIPAPRPKVDRKTSHNTVTTCDGTRITTTKTVTKIPPGAAMPCPSNASLDRSMAGSTRSSIGSSRMGPPMGRPNYGRAPMTGRGPMPCRPPMAARTPMPGRPTSPRPCPGSPPRIPAPTSARPCPGSARPGMGSMQRPPMKKVTSKTTIIEQKPGMRTTKSQMVEKNIPPQTCPPMRPGQYIMQMKHKPHEKEGRYQKYSSPVQMRRELEEGMPKGMKGYMFPHDMRMSQRPADLLRREPFQDTRSGVVMVCPPGQREEELYYSPPQSLDDRADPELATELYGDNSWSPQFSTPPAPTARRRPDLPMDVELAQDITCLSTQHPDVPVCGRAAMQEEVCQPRIRTPQGMQAVDEGLTIGERIERTPRQEIITRRLEAVESECGGMATQSSLITSDADPRGAIKRGPGGILDDTPSREVMEVVSSISFTDAGLKVSKEVVTYESTKPAGHNNEEIAAMVAEENQDIEDTLKVQVPELTLDVEDYPLKKKLRSLHLKTGSVSMLEQSIVHTQPTADEDQEEIQPELMAAIMHTEEQGVTMGTKPTQLYNFLFPEETGETVLNVSTVAPQPLEDVVVPIQIPSKLHMAAPITELSQVAQEMAQQQTQPPADDIYTEHVMKKAGPKIRNVATVKKKKAKSTPIDKEQPPWETTGGEVMEVVGADVSRLDKTALDASVSIVDETDTRIEFMLTLDQPHYMSRVQLRGSHKPIWFPGYVSAFPEIPDLIRVEKSPSTVLSMAWKAVQPNHFPESSIIGG